MLPMVRFRSEDDREGAALRARRDARCKVKVQSPLPRFTTHW